MSKYSDFKGKIRGLSKPELVAKAAELKTQIVKLGLEMGVRKTKNLRQKFNLRKHLALVNTMINQKNT